MVVDFIHQVLVSRFNLGQKTLSSLVPTISCFLQDISDTQNFIP